MTNFKRILTVLGVVWAFGFLLVFYQYSQNGKYQTVSSEAMIVLNTRTGAYHLLTRGENQQVLHPKE